MSLTYRRAALAVALTVCMPAALFACLWDHDTLRQERARPLLKKEVNEKE
jgi:hypothetical protein